jgi:hypothetical protein
MRCLFILTDSSPYYLLLFLLVGGTESLGIYQSLVLRPLWPIVQTPMTNEDDFWSNWWNKNWQGKPKY